MNLIFVRPVLNQITTWGLELPIGAIIWVHTYIVFLFNRENVQSLKNREITLQTLQ